MNKSIIEEKREISIDGEYDVIVVGGGIAGISAALSAKREGAKTLLIEREYALGGLATLGLVTIYLPLCDGVGNQVSFGIAEELLKLSVKYGAEIDIPLEWKEKNALMDKKKRYSARFSSNLMAILCEELLVAEGVEILYGTLVCGTSVKGHRIESVIVENKSGRNAFSGRCFIDATGDAQLAFYADEEVTEYSKGNSLAAWYYAHEKENIVLHPLGAADIVDENTELENEVASIKVELSNGCKYSGLDAKENTQFMIAAHRTMKEHFLSHGNVSESHNLVSMAMMPQLRMTRKLVGKKILEYSCDIVKHNDSIGVIGDWTRKGPRYEIPFGCLEGVKTKNLFVAGRCISTDDKMWEMTRVIPASAVTGEAAGIAAAIYEEDQGVNIKEIQKRLTKRGIPVHM